MNFTSLKGPITSFKQLVEGFNKIPRKHSTLLIGIDGCGGSGKSTFADKLKKQCSDVTIVHMDDLYFPSFQIRKDHPSKKLLVASSS